MLLCLLFRLLFEPLLPVLFGQHVEHLADNFRNAPLMLFSKRLKRLVGGLLEAYGVPPYTPLFCLPIEPLGETI